MKTRVVLVVLLMVILPGALYAQESDPAVVVQAAYDAWNAGDAETLKSLYAADAVVSFPDFGDTESGAEAIAAWIDELLAVNFATEIESVEASGETVTVVAKVWADPTRALGIAPLVTTDLYTVRDGLITSQTSTLSEESAAKLMAAMAPQEMPETGGIVPPGSAVLAGLGVLVLMGGAGMVAARKAGWKSLGRGR